jgi:hypothetical protein
MVPQPFLLGSCGLHLSPLQSLISKAQLLLEKFGVISRANGQGLKNPLSKPRHSFLFRDSSKEATGDLDKHPWILIWKGPPEPCGLASGPETTSQAICCC